MFVLLASRTAVVSSGPSSAAAGPGPRRLAAPAAEAAATKSRRVCIVRISALPSLARRPSGVHLARGSSRSYPFVPAAVSHTGSLGQPHLRQQHGRDHALRRGLTSLSIG